MRESTINRYDGPPSQTNRKSVCFCRFETAGSTKKEFISEEQEVSRQADNNNMSSANNEMGLEWNLTDFIKLCRKRRLRAVRRKPDSLYSEGGGEVK